VTGYLLAGLLCCGARVPAQGPFENRLAGFAAFQFNAPESWRLPVRLGLVSEFSFQKTRYEENFRRVAFASHHRPRVFAMADSVQSGLERALHGPGTARGRNLELTLLAALDADESTLHHSSITARWKALAGL